MYFGPDCVEYRGPLIIADRLQVAKVLYIHFLTKILELADTVFMIVRCKDKQLSFLHVYHHVIILNTWWWVLKYIPGGVC